LDAALTMASSYAPTARLSAMGDMQPESTSADIIPSKA
jgi:hypothetical protein